MTLLKLRDHWVASNTTAKYAARRMARRGIETPRQSAIIAQSWFGSLAKKNRRQREQNKKTRRRKKKKKKTIISTKCKQIKREELKTRKHAKTASKLGHYF